MKDNIFGHFRTRGLAELPKRLAKKKGMLNPHSTTREKLADLRRIMKAKDQTLKRRDLRIKQLVNKTKVLKGINPSNFNISMTQLQIILLQ